MSIYFVNLSVSTGDTSALGTSASPFGADQFWDRLIYQ